ncbi:LAGLIDADG endonuclease (mitochondrion) [Podila verticillata NRRL 6337]|jgi:LAGLIDADG endonuclease|uniref:LAGLIDADG endonuclease n=2 Tax=Podila verticillata TaxID=78898 RepID=A0A086VL73_9FUNG|nr:orf295 [Podila verticillata]AAW51686.1 orf295 [Podila verticillata]KFH98272.1 LAGLIDADG endonuclease [Podila verticillata NRRL 6337]
MNKNNSNLTWFITGLTEAEGCFNINIYKTKAGKKTAKLRFSIAVMENDLELLKLVKDCFNCGTISESRTNGMRYFTVSKISDINNIIIPHFQSYLLRGTKLLDFEDWVLAANIIITKSHLTEEGIEKLQLLFDGMNRKRNKLENFLPDHCNKNSSLFIPINGNYISGFIAGDGSINIHPFSLTFDSLKFCSIFLSITQHKNNLFLMNEIKDFFNVNNKLKIQSNNSVQLLIENKEFFRSTLIPFFNKYPLHGIKLINLNKIIKILELINKYGINRSNSYTSDIRKEIINIWFAET